MKTAWRTEFIYYTVSLLLLVSSPAFASDPWGDSKRALEAAGYELNVAGLRRVFSEGGPLLTIRCLDILQSEDTQDHYRGLVPDVKKYMRSLPEHIGRESLRMYCVAALLHIETDMSEEDRNVYLERIRKNLFPKPGHSQMSLGSYPALLNAHRYQGIDIKDDLILICEAPYSQYVSALVGIALRDLIELYGASLQEAELLRLLDRWHANPEMESKIIKGAEKHSFFLKPIPLNSVGRYYSPAAEE